MAKNIFIISISEENHFTTKRHLWSYGKIVYESTFLPIIGLETDKSAEYLSQIQGVERVNEDQTGTF